MPATGLALAGPHLLFVGLESKLASEILQHLPHCTSTIVIDHEMDQLMRRLAPSADILFCRADHPALPGLLDAAKAGGAPVIVVTERPDVEGWLNAMDAGAADYAVPPFDRMQMNWILQTNLRVATTR